MFRINIDFWDFVWIGIFVISFVVVTIKELRECHKKEKEEKKKEK